MLLGLCDIESKVAAAREPLQADLTGGLADVELDLAELAANAREDHAARRRERGRGGRRARHDSRVALPLPGAIAPHRRPHGTTSTSIPPIWS